MDRQAVQQRFGIAGSSKALHQAIDRTRLVARTDVTVLIEGESGTGKELIANAIHGLSKRRHGRLQVINMGAIPEGLIEAELFGAEKGAYTNSIERRIGYFEKADGGTIFLDEIGEMPPAAQVRLLRVLESGSFNRVGSSTMRSTDTRVVAATNKDLGKEVEAGRFREDLYYRISTVIIRLPPLRDRQDDILVLFRRFLHEFAEKYSATPRNLTEEALAVIAEYHWPGNVRELRNVAEAATITYPHATVDAEMVRPLLRGITQSGSTAVVPVVREGKQESDGSRERALIYRAMLNQQITLEELRDQVGRLSAGLEDMSTFLRDGRAAMPVGGAEREVRMLPEADGEALIEYEDASEDDEAAQVEPAEEPIPTIASMERELVIRALEHFSGSRRKAAQALGISERSLYRRAKAIAEEEAAA